ncbi:hypothetical protein H2198_003499 [Neophaeococcomyces mojaviensis]|uniref:Uncharacterized protein n=1 Tax=Neophaeococcomyces mojaviensis TaxID=3383035 RepID=A0ACC3ABM8_9EURO|nr:hypothetical protein H2198_003499 [Knufia sp. JES_112]
MAPPENTFPVHELPDRIHLKSSLHNSDYSEKSRKLPKDFNILRDCELYELVQYSCTTQEELQEHAMAQLHARGGTRADPKRMECFPFVRLFRKCKYGNQEFNVETTALEGRYAWKMSKSGTGTAETEKTQREAEVEVQRGDGHDGSWGGWMSNFWSGK